MSRSSRDRTVVSKLAGRPGFELDLAVLGDRGRAGVQALLAYAMFDRIWLEFADSASAAVINAPRETAGRDIAARLADRLFREALPSYAIHRVFPRVPQWRYGCPPELAEADCRAVAARDADLVEALSRTLGGDTTHSFAQAEVRYLAARIAKCLEGRLDPKGITLLGVAEFSRRYLQPVTQDLRGRCKTEPLGNRRQ